MVWSRRGRQRACETCCRLRSTSDGVYPAGARLTRPLEFLVLHNNRLTGPIPPELGRLPNLTELELWGNELTGLIPPELARLANLRRLHLNSNNLTGSIPHELGALANLRRLHLDNNRLTGPIPPELGALANLEYLHLHSNELTGGIPAELGRLANLTRLHLGSNNLTGPIPQELGALTSLEILVLDNNRLTGPVPPDFLSLTNLSHLNLANNYGLCVPGTSDFVSWRQQSNDQGGVEYCNDDERAALEILYEVTGGFGLDELRWMAWAMVRWANGTGVTADALGPGHRARLERQRTQGTASRHPGPTVPIDRVAGGRQRAWPAGCR